jgi:hypothetical protein
MKPKLFVGPIECPSRLAAIGLKEEVLWSAVMRGRSAAANLTLNHPPLYRGVTPWGETTCALREALLLEGWKRSDDGNLPFTVNKSETLAITVATGDKDTGRPDACPCTRSTKGPRTAKAISRNSMASTLFGDIRLRPEDLKLLNRSRMTWILLFYHDGVTDELRCELSLPSKMNTEGYVDGWLERIILGSRPFDGGLAKRPSDAPQTPEIEVDVKRRHG